MPDDERITRLAGDGTQGESGGGFPLPDAVHEIMKNVPATTAELAALLKSIPVLSMRELRVFSIWNDGSNPWEGMAEDLAESLTESGILQRKGDGWATGPSFRFGERFVIVPGREGKNRQVTTVVFAKSDPVRKHQERVAEAVMRVRQDLFFLEKDYPGISDSFESFMETGDEEAAVDGWTAEWIAPGGGKASQRQVGEKSDRRRGRHNWRPKVIDYLRQHSPSTIAQINRYASDNWDEWGVDMSGALNHLLRDMMEDGLVARTEEKRPHEYSLISGDTGP